ncbi:hypothetical protein DdX_11702 [Ditylenchus destructor]|uniref:Uncharacterized protein n=1 Tax=Ditylenchus destructor TaxID=166010 RepID=A0AAD4R428_9BILA|nr:hypothetical protein DdX_11702 [Ditylenchus destructor]
MGIECAFGLIHCYDNEADFALYCKMIPALSFVRLNDVKQYAATLFETLPDCLDQVASWFEHNYIGAEVRRGGRMVQIQLRFPHQLWNVHQRPSQNQQLCRSREQANSKRDGNGNANDGILHRSIETNSERSRSGPCEMASGISS